MHQITQYELQQEVSRMKAEMQKAGLSGYSTKSMNRPYVSIKTHSRQTGRRIPITEQDKFHWLLTLKLAKLEITAKQIESEQAKQKQPTGSLSEYIARYREEHGII